MEVRGIFHTYSMYLPLHAMLLESRKVIAENPSKIHFICRRTNSPISFPSIPPSLYSHSYVEMADSDWNVPDLYYAESKVVRLEFLTRVNPQVSRK